MRKVDPENTADRRSQVLTAALACFRRKGFAASTIAEICKEAGMSPGHLYHYFRSKDDIVAAIAERDRAVAATALDRLAREDDIVAALIRISGDDEDEGTFSIDGALAFEIYAEAGRNERVQSALRRNHITIRTGLAALLAEGQRRGEVDPDVDPEAAAVLVCAVYDGLTIAGRSDPDLATEAVANMLPRLFDGFLRADQGRGGSPAPRKARVQKNVAGTGKPG